MEYEKPTKDNVSIGNTLVERMNEKIIYLQINNTTEYSIHAISKDKNYSGSYPFVSLDELIIIKGEENRNLILIQMVLGI